MITTSVDLISALSAWGKASDSPASPNPADCVGVLTFATSAPCPPAEHMAFRFPLAAAAATRLAELVVRDTSRKHAERLAATLRDTISLAHEHLPDPYGDQAPDAEHPPMIVIYDTGGRDAPDGTGTSIWAHRLTGPVAATLTTTLRTQLGERFLLPDDQCWCDECDGEAVSGFCALASLLHCPIFARLGHHDQARIGMSILLRPNCGEAAPMWQFSDRIAQWLTQLLSSSGIALPPE
ncbi:hypothetical protein AB0C84_44430 [Actinomadura sp. NPDC048955]|uniref:hypothetical protein n=1 Tax=Actinomadura sp. NPDC048955 TaxID=3158228 RepID=UPI0033FF14E7